MKNASRYICSGLCWPSTHARARSEYRDAEGDRDRQEIVDRYWKHIDGLQGQNDILDIASCLLLRSSTSGR